MQLSIITINYNDKVGLSSTFKSVFDQTHQQFEYVVIDGGSSDGSKELIEQYAEKIDCWVSEPDDGIFNAMNKGINLSKGDFIMFINSGDSFHENETLSKISKKLNEGFDIFYGDVVRVYPNGTKKIKKYPSKLSFDFFVDSAIAHQSSVVKRTLFDEVFYFNENFKVFSDWQFFICATCKYNIPYKHLDLIVADFSMDGISSQANIQIEMHKEREETYRNYFPLFYEDYKSYNKLKKIFNSKRGKLFLNTEKNIIAKNMTYYILKIINFFFR